MIDIAVTSELACQAGYVCTPMHEWVLGTTLTLLGFALALALPLILWLIPKIEGKHDVKLLRGINLALTVVAIGLAGYGSLLASYWYIGLAVAMAGFICLMWVVWFTFVRGVAGEIKAWVQNTPDDDKLGQPIK